MTRDQLAAELTRIAKLQLSDITRAVKNGEKSIALNEVTDLARRLHLLSDAVAGRPAVAPGAQAPATQASVVQAPVVQTGAAPAPAAHP
ncbi:hypothetical protein ASG60_03570 [Methylobacterium sp. Leaf469]|uniref:hypothetical protein n=1 Tax=unclassified Methylobacterium TaxID=2615210 RepID=UPI0006F2251F|nr:MULTISPECIES: hypothetical protein [unclassified Methylobacterium]KQP34663.1 hypothetical protein ASF27_03795 [Methylobacterium sp. Leaf102]KQU05734.1 hypothetical protein ASG60_03570 [Methylobacterium sp. Leaf469]USU34550.1 hypothetical protein NG677_09005 [Methylobacterium sp. OTU13CASTA1]